MSKKKIYCEVEFFKQFVNMRPQANVPTKENIKKGKLWNDLFLFLDSASINFDDAQEFAKLAHENEYFKMLWKASIYKKDKLDFLKDKYPKLDSFDGYKSDNDIMTSMFFSTKSNSVCKGVQKEFGVIAIPIANVFNSSHFFQTRIETISSGDESHSDWGFMDRLKHPSNSLCFIDAYIFNSEEALNYNLIPILNSLLPNSLSVPYHISIFARNNIDIVSEEIFKSAKSRISLKLKELKPDLKTEISVYRTTVGNFHDRAIVTNNMIIESGSGFDLFRSLARISNAVGSINKTTVSAQYISFQVDQSSKEGKEEKNLADFLLNSSRDVFNSSRNRSNKNRLLEQ